MMKAMLFSGALAGLCGAVHVTSVGKRFISGFSPGYGFSGISVAALASDSPLGIILAGIIFVRLKNRRDVSEYDESDSNGVRQRHSGASRYLCFLRRF